MTAPRSGAAAAFLQASIGLLLGWTASPAAAQTTAPLTLQGPGPYYRLVLPTALYPRAASDDLRDVRVRNAAGQPVPFAWLDSPVEATTAEPATSAQVPFFAVPGPGVASTTTGPTPAGTDIALRIRPDGSLALGGGASGPIEKTNEWWLDASGIGGEILQVTFTLATDAQGIFPFALDASDDLRRWRPLVEHDVLVRLDRSGQHIERLNVELTPGPARYLRLRWLDPGRTATLAGVALDSRPTPPAAAPVLEWSADLAPSSCAEDHCDYRVPRGLPIDSLRISLSEPNVLAPVRISALVAQASEPRRVRPHNPLYLLRHRHRNRIDPAVEGEWSLADTVLYRLDAAGGGPELRSPAVTLDGAPHAVLRLRTEVAGIAALGRTPPRLSIGTRPRAMVFLASGAAPFVLSWNGPGGTAPRESAVPLPVDVLMRSEARGGALAQVPTGTASVTLPPLPVVEAATERTPSASTPVSKAPWLWAALAVGLAALGAMAWSLLRSVRTASASDPKDVGPPA